MLNLFFLTVFFNVLQELCSKKFTSEGIGKLKGDLAKSWYCQNETAPSGCITLPPTIFVIW